MNRRATLLAAAALGGGAWFFALRWLVRPDDGLNWLCISLGFLALFPGAALVGAAGPRLLRRALAVLALSALPVGMATSLGALAPTVYQGGGWSGNLELANLTLIVCRRAVPEEEWRERPLCNIRFDQYGGLDLGRTPVTLRILRSHLPRIPREDLRLVVDRDTPWRNILWLMAELASAGVDRIHLAATAGYDAWYIGAEAEMLGLDPGPTWPVRRIPHPLVNGHSGQGALEVDVVARSERNRIWRLDEGEVTVRVPTRVRYRFRNRQTEHVDELAAWLREAAPQGALSIRVRAHPRMPAKFVIAAVTAAFDVGAIGWETGVIPPLPEAERDRFHLSYPR